MLRILVTIPSETALTLRELAGQELRTPRDEAAILLMEAVRRRQQQARRRRAPQREREAVSAAS